MKNILTVDFANAHILRSMAGKAGNDASIGLNVPVGIKGNIKVDIQLQSVNSQSPGTRSLASRHDRRFECGCRLDSVVHLPVGTVADLVDDALVYEDMAAAGLFDGCHVPNYISQLGREIGEGERRGVQCVHGATKGLERAPT